MLPPPDQLTRHVLTLCREAGFDRWGIAGVGPSRHADDLRRWLAQGRQGSMAWLAEHLHVRTDPGRLLRGSRAIVMVATRYAARGDVDAAIAEGSNPHHAGRAPGGGADPAPQPLAASARSPLGRIARYARGRDYHRAMKKRLHAICDRLRAEFPAHECRAFTDIEPMPERELAARAGLGWIGKHTLVIDPRLGSWLVLGGFATTLPLEAPPEQSATTDHCGTCTRCIDACPTGAITPYSVDASRCISYLTIERREPIPPEFHAPIGDWLFGCDVCQEVCPHNSARPGHSEPAPSPPSAHAEIAGARATLPLLGVLAWTPADRSRALSASVIKRATLLTLKRNAIIALGNHARRSPDPAIIARLQAFRDDPAEPELLRITARDVLAALAPPA